jgi:hypothetical protein
MISTASRGSNAITDRTTSRALASRLVAASPGRSHTAWTTPRIISWASAAEIGWHVEVMEDTPIHGVDQAFFQDRPAAST